MKQSKHLVSVIIPSHNGEKYLHEAIYSIRNQSLPVFEIIVVDDGSINPVSELTSFDTTGIRIVRKENGGQGSAINVGINLAQGDLIAFLDHDDCWEHDKNELQTNFLISNDFDVVVGQVVNEWIKNNGTSRRQNMGSARLFGACLFKSEVFSYIGPVAQDGQIHEVIDWWSRAGEKLKIGKSDDIALIRRVHGENLTLQDNHHDRSDLLLRVRENLRRNHGQN
jgi:glycosyltransferase involved in cell wall biosynthesis